MGSLYLGSLNRGICHWLLLGCSGAPNLCLAAEAGFGLDNKVAGCDVTYDDCGRTEANGFGGENVTDDLALDEEGFDGDGGFNNGLALDREGTIRFNFSFDSSIEDQPFGELKSAYDTDVVGELVDVVTS